jgi:hypothetical protein
VLRAWPGTDTALDNDQFQAFAAAHLGQKKVQKFALFLAKNNIQEALL